MNSQHKASAPVKHNARLTLDGAGRRYIRDAALLSDDLDEGTRCDILRALRRAEGHTTAAVLDDGTLLSDIRCVLLSTQGKWDLHQMPAITQLHVTPRRCAMGRMLTLEAPISWWSQLRIWCLGLVSEGTRVVESIRLHRILETPCQVDIDTRQLQLVLNVDLTPPNAVRSRIEKALHRAKFTNMRGGQRAAQ